MYEICRSSTQWRWFVQASPSSSGAKQGSILPHIFAVLGVVCGADTKAKIWVRMRLPYKFSGLTSSRSMASGARADASKMENNKTQQTTTQAAQALFMNHTRNTIWRRIIRVCMGFSTRYPWRSLKVKIFHKNGLPYSLRLLFTPGVVILPI